MAITPDDTAPMQQAIDASRRAWAAGNMPFGASLVSPAGEVLHVSGNNQVTAGDCTGHAELVLVREATRQRGAQALRGATVYASGEPCAMCSGALFWAGVARLVYAASQDQIADALGGSVLPIRSADVLAGASPALQVDGPVLAQAALVVLREAGARLNAGSA